MGTVPRNDFIVDSKGLCFFCLNQIDVNNDKLQCPSITVKSQPPSIRSLSWLSRYLKVDIRKVLHENVPTTSAHLLDKVERSQLKAELCANCTNLSDQVTKLSLHVERIEMEISTYLEILSSKLGQVGRDPDSESAIGLEALFDKRKLEIMELLRKEAKMKCTHKLGHTLPRIALQKLSMNEVNEKISKIQRKWIKGSTTTQNDEINISHVKQESPHHDYASEKEENNDCDGSVGSPLSPATAVEYECDAETNQDLQNSGHGNANGSNGVHSQAVYSKSSLNKRVKLEERDGDPSHNNRCRIITLSGESTATGAPVMENCVVNPETGRHKCKKCSKEYSAFIGFYFHYRGEHLNIRYSCSVCQKLFKQMSNLNTHQSRCHKGVRYMCPGCNQTFELESKLSTHGCDARHSADNSQTNIVTGGSSPHLETRVWKCSVCGKLCNSISGLQSHTRGLHGTQTYNCDVCNKNFRTRSGRTIHRLRVHSIYKSVGKASPPGKKVPTSECLRPVDDRQ